MALNTTYVWATSPPNYNLSPDLSLTLQIYILYILIYIINSTGMSHRRLKLSMFKTDSWSYPKTHTTCSLLHLSRSSSCSGQKTLKSFFYFSLQANMKSVSKSCPFYLQDIPRIWPLPAICSTLPLFLAWNSSIHTWPIALLLPGSP